MGEHPILLPADYPRAGEGVETEVDARVIRLILASSALLRSW